MAEEIDVGKLLHEVIAPFLIEPTKSFSFKELRKQSKYSEQSIKDQLNELVKNKILIESRAVGRPPKKTGPPLKIYKINLNSEAFSHLLSFYSNESIKNFLSTNYCNKFIEKYGFGEAYRLIEPKLKNSDFKRIASISLLNLTATKEEFKNFSKNFTKDVLQSIRNETAPIEEGQHDKEISSYLNFIDQKLTRKSIYEIEILSSFEPLHAVRFYRDTLNLPLTLAYEELEKKSFITRGFKDFLVFDNYLSPLTAHPANSIVKILFSNSFERIYEDAYLLDGDAFRVLSGRAAAIYNSFSDIIFEYFKQGFIGLENMKIVTKQLIFFWNVASTRFDYVCYYLNQLYENEVGSGNYHLKGSGLNYHIIDLESGQLLLKPEISSSLLVSSSTPLKIGTDVADSTRLKPEVMDKPFTVLRPCITFSDLGWDSDPIHFGNIFRNLEQKLSK